MYTTQQMKTKKRHEFRSDKEMKGWLNISGSSHLENPNDVFVRPTKWGLFKWNKENFYPLQNATSLHDEEVSHVELVCRPVAFL